MLQNGARSAAVAEDQTAMTDFSLSPEKMLQDGARRTAAIHEGVLSEDVNPTIEVNGKAFV